MLKAFVMIQTYKFQWAVDLLNEFEAKFIRKRDRFCLFKVKRYMEFIIYQTDVHLYRDNNDDYKTSLVQFMETLNSMLERGPRAFSFLYTHLETFIHLINFNSFQDVLLRSVVSAISFYDQQNRNYIMVDFLMGLLLANHDHENDYENKIAILYCNGKR